MAEKINLIFFDFGTTSVLVNELIKFYKESPKFNVESLDNAAEANQFISTTSNGIFFFKVSNKKDLQGAVGILKSQKKLIKKGLVKPACITSIKNKKVEAVLAKYGCVDLLEPDTKAKTLSFKMDFWSKPIVAQLEKIAKDEEFKLKQQNNAQKKAEKEKHKSSVQTVKDIGKDIQKIKERSTLSASDDIQFAPDIIHATIDVKEFMRHREVLEKLPSIRNDKKLAQINYANVSVSMTAQISGVITGILSANPVDISTNLYGILMGVGAYAQTGANVLQVDEKLNGSLAEEAERNAYVADIAQERLKENYIEQNPHLASYYDQIENEGQDPPSAG